jgi:hypothetical protein
MKRILQLGIFVSIIALTSSRAMSFSGGIGVLLAIPKFAINTNADAGGDRVNRIERGERVERFERGAEFVISIFDRHIVTEFGKAWRSSGNGMTDSESVVLILRMLGGGYAAKSLGATNERRQFTFRWHPGAIAIVHTHPNNASPRPQEADCQVADRYGVPVFTLSREGMFAYDPYTKKITRVQNGLKWLELSSWSRASVASGGAQ